MSHSNDINIFKMILSSYDVKIVVFCYAFNLYHTITYVIDLVMGNVVLKHTSE